MKFKTQTHRHETMTGLTSEVGEPLERKIERIMQNGEPIRQEFTMLYSDSNEVLENTNVRTDKWDIAVETMTKVHQMHSTKKPNTSENDNKTVTDKGAKETS